MAPSYKKSLVLGGMSRPAENLANEIARVLVSHAKILITEF